MSRGGSDLSTAPVSKIREKVVYGGRGDMEPNPWFDHVNFDVEKILKEAFSLNMLRPRKYCYWSGHYQPERLRRFGLLQVPHAHSNKA